MNQHIIEGRDEALEHLYVNPTKWDALTDKEKATRIRWIAGFTPTTDAAALTITEAEMNMAPCTRKLGWIGLAIRIRLIRYRQTDYTLQA